MIFLKKNKDLLDSESYIFGTGENQQILIPFHNFENMVSICPQCGKIITVDEEIFRDVLDDLDESEEDLDFDNLEVYCTNCSTKRYMKELKDRKKLTNSESKCHTSFEF